MSNTNLIKISDLQTIVIGGTWKKTLDLIPKTGVLNITAVADYLMKRNSTSNVDSSYVTGSPSYSGSQVTTGQVGTPNPPAGRYTYFLTITTDSSIFVLYQDFEFKPMKGN